LDRREFDPRDLNPVDRAIDDAQTERRVSADSLREQAASCRRLAGTARTRSGLTSLQALGDHFDDQARKLDPFSERR
jgi:hypothetical protein